MYIVDGIAYAGNPASERAVRLIVPYGEHKILLSFDDGAEKLFDFAPLLGRPAFEPLKDKAVFESVTLDHGVPTWLDGEIDISPAYLYQEGTPVRSIS